MIVFNLNRKKLMISKYGMYIMFNTFGKLRRFSELKKDPFKN